LGTRLTQRGFRHDGVGFSDNSIPGAVLRRKRPRLRFKAPLSRNDTVGAARMFDRLISEIVDPIDCGAKLCAFGLKGSGPGLECLALAVGSDPKGSKFISLRP
jgi:hypothetical protein